MPQGQRQKTTLAKNHRHVTWCRNPQARNLAANCQPDTRPQVVTSTLSSADMRLRKGQHCEIATWRHFFVNSGQVGHRQIMDSHAVLLLLPCLALGEYLKIEPAAQLSLFLDLTISPLTHYPHEEVTKTTEHARVCSSWPLWRRRWCTLPYSWWSETYFRGISLSEMRECPTGSNAGNWSIPYDVWKTQY